MYLRVFDSRDRSRQTTPSPSLCHYLTHEHRSIGYPNRNPQSLDESTTRLMYLRVYDSRPGSRQPAPSPSLVYSLTHTHRSIGHLNRNLQPLSGSPARLMYLRVYDSRVSSRQPPYVYMTVELALTSLHPPRPYATRSHMHTAPSPLPRSSRSHALRYFGFLSV